MSILILDTSTRWGVHDIETTGLTDADRIVQFGCCFFQGRHKSDEVELLLNPGIPIPEQVSQLHGITTAMVADKPTMALVGQRIHAALTDRQMAVAFNGRRFDDQWLMRELAGAGIEYSPKPIVDVFDFLWYFRRDAAEDGKGHKLTDWAERAGLPAFDAHSAVADCMATGQLLIWAIDQGIIPETVDDACAVGDAIAKFIDREKELYGTAFYFDRNSTDPLASVRMGFGKHRGVNLNQMPSSYLSWLVDKSDQPDNVKQIARSILRGNLIRPHEDLVMLRESIAVARMRATVKKEATIASAPAAATEEVFGTAICPLCKTEERKFRLLVLNSANEEVEATQWSKFCDTCRESLEAQKCATGLCWRCEHRVESNAQLLIGQLSAGPMMACDVMNPKEIEDMEACPQFHPVTPQSLSALMDRLNLSDMWAVQSDPDTVLLTLVTPKPVGAEDNADAVLPQEQAARYAMALDGIECLTEGKFVQLSTFVDTAQPEGKLTTDEVETPIRAAMTRFVAEFFGSGATWQVKRGRFNRLTVTLKLQFAIPEGLLRMTTRCLSSLLCEVAESLDTPWAGSVPFADVRVVALDTAMEFGFPAIPHVTLGPVVKDGDSLAWSDLRHFSQVWPLSEETSLRMASDPLASSAHLLVSNPESIAAVPTGHVYRVLLGGKTIAFELSASLEALRKEYAPDVEFCPLSENECKAINLSQPKPVGELSEGEKQETVSLAKVAEAAKQTLAWREQGVVELFQWVTGINAAVPLDR